MPLNRAHAPTLAIQNYLASPGATVHLCYFQFDIHLFKSIYKKNTPYQDGHVTPESLLSNITVYELITLQEIHAHLERIPKDVSHLVVEDLDYAFNVMAFNNYKDALTTITRTMRRLRQLSSQGVNIQLTGCLRFNSRPVTKIVYQNMDS